MGYGAYTLVMTGNDELKAALRGSRNGFRDLRRTYAQIAEDAAQYVEAHVPRGSASAKDGAAHKALPALHTTVTSGATVNATLLNHKTSAALGTKASGATWAFTVTITLS